MKPYLDLDLEEDRERLCQEVEAAARELVAALARFGIHVDEKEAEDHLWGDLKGTLTRW
jgi:hypothetical protein